MSEFNRMYGREGGNVPPPETPAKREPVVEAQRPVDDGKTVTMIVEGKPVRVPSPTYVAHLEEKVAKLTRSVDAMKRDLRKVIDNHNKSILELREVRRELNNKVDLRD